MQGFKNVVKHWFEPVAPFCFPLFISLVVVGTDQLTKLFFGFLGWPTILNLGVAFGLFPSWWWPWIGLAILSGLTAWLVRDGDRLSKLTRIGAGMLLGGGLSNILDRILVGSVRDYPWLPWLPAFNLADLAIVLGLILILGEELNWGGRFKRRFKNGT